LQSRIKRRRGHDATATHGLAWILLPFACAIGFGLLCEVSIVMSYCRLFHIHQPSSENRQVPISVDLCISYLLLWRIFVRPSGHSANQCNRMPIAIDDVICVGASHVSDSVRHGPDTRAFLLYNSSANAIVLQVSAESNAPCYCRDEIVAQRINFHIYYCRGPVCYFSTF
jgi:hypothetical protein